MAKKKKTIMCFLHFLGAVVGFDPVVYNVNEGTGSVELTIRVMRGELEETVFVDFSTQDGSARGIMLTVGMLSIVINRSGQ